MGFGEQTTVEETYALELGSVSGFITALLGADDLDRQLDIDDPTTGVKVRRAAKAFIVAWHQRSVIEKREALLLANVAVLVGSGCVEVSVAPVALGYALLETLPSKDIDSPEPARLTRSVVVALHRVRGEARIVEDSQEAAVSVTSSSRDLLLKKIALGRKWARELVSGEVASLKALSVRERTAESSLCDVLRAGCLAPSLVQELMDGTLKVQVRLKDFREGFPIPWDHQREYLSRQDVLQTGLVGAVGR